MTYDDRHNFFLDDEKKVLPTTPSVMILLNRPYPRKDHILRLYKKVNYVIAADGGVNRLFDAIGRFRKELKPDIIIGDLDSITEYTTDFYKKQGVTIEQMSNTQKNDFEKALEVGLDYIKTFYEKLEQGTLLTEQEKELMEVINDSQHVPHGDQRDQFVYEYDRAMGPDKLRLTDYDIENAEAKGRVIVYGAFGGRMDQTLQNLHLFSRLYNDVSKGGWMNTKLPGGRTLDLVKDFDVLLMDDENVASYLPPGDHMMRPSKIWESDEGCGLVALGPDSPADVATDGLIYDLGNYQAKTLEPLSFGGNGLISSSNGILDRRVRVYNPNKSIFWFTTTRRDPLPRDWDELMERRKRSLGIRNRRGSKEVQQLTTHERIRRAAIAREEYLKQKEAERKKDDFDHDISHLESDHDEHAFELRQPTPRVPVGPPTPVPRAIIRRKIKTFAERLAEKDSRALELEKQKRRTMLTLADPTREQQHTTQGSLRRQPRKHTTTKMREEEDDEKQEVSLQYYTPLKQSIFRMEYAESMIPLSVPHSNAIINEVKHATDMFDGERQGHNQKLMTNHLVTQINNYLSSPVDSTSAMSRDSTLALTATAMILGLLPVIGWLVSTQRKRSFGGTQRMPLFAEDL